MDVASGASVRSVIRPSPNLFASASILASILPAVPGISLAPIASQRAVSIASYILRAVSPFGIYLECVLSL